MRYILSEEQEKKWEISIEIAILKQLYKDKMLTDMQLNQLIHNIKNQI